LKKYCGKDQKRHSTNFSRRKKEKLCEPLDSFDAPIITAILEGIAQPDSLKWFEQD